MPLSPTIDLAYNNEEDDEISDDVWSYGHSDDDFIRKSEFETIQKVSIQYYLSPHHIIYNNINQTSTIFYF